MESFTKRGARLLQRGRRNFTQQRHCSSRPDIMTREEIILSHIKRHDLGLETGAGCAPIAPKKQGFRVHVLDHCDRKALIENIDRTGSTSTTSRRLISFG